MRKIKKTLCILLIATMVLGLAACGGDTEQPAAENPAETENTSPNTETSKNTEKTVINFWHCMGGDNGERIERMVDRFNKSQDKIEVKATYQGSYEEGNAKLQTAIAGGTAPDIAQIERAFVEPYANASRLEDLKPYMEKSGTISPDDFVEGLMGYSYYNDDGKLVSIPFCRSTPIFYYNKDAFKEAGLDPETAPETWEDVIEYANKLTKVEDGKTVRYGYTFPVATWYFKANVAQLDGRTINEDKTAIGFYDNGVGKKVLEYWTGLRDSGVYMLPPTKDGALVARQAFINGETCMFEESTSIIGTLTENCNFELGAAFLPYASEGHPAMPTGGSNIAIMADSKNKEAAWTFLEWLINNPEGCLQFVIESGYLPFTKQMVESPEIQELWANNPVYRVAYDQLQYAVDTEQHQYWAELKSEILAAEQAVMNDNADIDKTLDNLYSRSLEILAQ